MNWNNGVRQAHRWLGVIFTLTVIVSMVAAGQQDPAVWVFYLPLPPLVLQLVTGLHLFALPYVATRRGARSATHQT